MKTKEVTRMTIKGQTRMTIEGKTVVFTGKISRPRLECQRLVMEHGGMPGSSVTRNTDYLVVGEAPGSKLAKATTLGTKVISEDEFLKLLEPEEQTEEPLTPEELKELQSHTVTLTCKWCHHTYKQWDTLPDRETCPICELLTFPKCPHCDDNPTYVEDFNLYHCMTCGTWFEAPFSVHARKTKHLHMWIKTSQVRKGKIRKTCVCGATIYLEPEDMDYQKELYSRAPELVKQWQTEREEQATKRVQEEKAKEWFASLKPEQITQLKEQLNAK